MRSIPQLEAQVFFQNQTLCRPFYLQPIWLEITQKVEKKTQDLIVYSVYQSRISKSNELQDQDNQIF